MAQVPDIVRQMAESMATTVPQAAALGFRLISVDVGRGSIEAPWREDLVGDGTHPSDSGRKKVAELLLEFFKTDANAKTWFVKKS